MSIVKFDAKPSKPVFEDIRIHASQSGVNNFIRITGGNIGHEDDIKLYAHCPDTKTAVGVPISFADLKEAVKIIEESEFLPDRGADHSLKIFQRNMAHDRYWLP